MSKKKNDVNDFADLFKDLKSSTEEVEGLLKQAAEAEIKQEETQVVEVAKTTPAKSVSMSQAFGLHKNEETGKWHVAEIHYNPVTGEARIHNDAALTNISKAVSTARATEMITRISLGLSIKNVKGYK